MQEVPSSSPWQHTEASYNEKLAGASYSVSLPLSLPLFFSLCFSWDWKRKKRPQEQWNWTDEKPQVSTKLNRWPKDSILKNLFRRKVHIRDPKKPCPWMFRLRYWHQTMEIIQLPNNWPIKCGVAIQQNTSQQEKETINWCQAQAHSRRLVCSKEQKADRRQWMADSGTPADTMQSATSQMQKVIVFTWNTWKDNSTDSAQGREGRWSANSLQGISRSDRNVLKLACCDCCTVGCTY